MNEENQSGDVSVSAVEANDAEVKESHNDRGKAADPENRPEPLHLKTKTIPAIVTLLGTLVAAVDVFVQQIEFKKSLVIILVSLVVFLIAGELVKILLDHIELPNPDAEDLDGNVIEKGKSEGEEGSEGAEEEAEGASSSEAE